MSGIDDQNRDPLEILAAEFTDRQRRGEHPSVSEYIGQYPELAAEIEELFPAIAAVERLKTHRAASHSGRASLGGVRLERLGDFRILGEIGRGGMGIVYEAFQESLGRHVAVKVLPKQSLLDPKQLQRFHREAQTAARLHHTNIVPLFGVGEQDGFHYLVMQLIRGVGLDAVIMALRPPPTSGQPAPPPGAAADAANSSEAGRLARLLVEGQFRQGGASGPAADSRSGGVTGHDVACDAAPGPLEPTADSVPERGSATTQVSADTLPARAIAPPVAAPPPACRLGASYWRSVAAIGMQAADALHYAHLHHTLHRDIKPGNLLLDRQGVVWITDFGLAKMIDDEQASHTVGLAGTLRYMAPEQFAGQSDARSDIYSLGLTLYELLTLEPAFSDSSRSRLIQQVAQGSPPSPRKLNPSVPRDLETIVLKAIAREPADRYTSAADLARDLQCFLDDRPIAARRSSAPERLWRWARRNRAVAGLAASTLVLLFLVAVVASVGYIRTVQANVEEARQRKKAEGVSSLALEALDDIFRQFAPERTAPASTLVVVDDAGEEITVPVQPVLSKEAALLLEHMLAFYDRLAAQGGNDLQMRRKVAQANRRVGDIRQRLGDYEQSKTSYQRAIAIYAELSRDAPADAELHTEIARIHNELGSVYWALNEPEAGQAAFRAALATLSAVASGSAPQYRYELARTHYSLGKRLGSPMGPPPLAPGGRRGSRGGPPGEDFAPGRPRGPRGNEFAPPPGSLDGGRTFGPPNADRRRRDGPPGFGPPPNGGRREQGPDLSPRERQESLQNAIDLLEPLVAEYPKVPDYRHLLARCYRELSPETAQKAAAILEELVTEHPDVPDFRYDLCETYAWLIPPGFLPGQASEESVAQSQALLEKARVIAEELVAEHPNIPDYASSLVHVRLRLAALAWQSDASTAETYLGRARDLQQSLVRRFPQNGSYQFGMIAINESLAAWRWEHDQLNEARVLLEDSIASLHSMLDRDPQAGFLRGVLAHHYANLADLLRQMNDEPAAAEAQRQADQLRPPHRHQ